VIDAVKIGKLKAMGCGRDCREVRIGRQRVSVLCTAGTAA
jgi:hypothetical protein